MKNLFPPPGAALVGTLSLTVLSLAFSAPAQAITTWNWSFTGNGDQSAAGTFTTADVTPQAEVTYTITGITGTYNRDSVAYAITGLTGPSLTPPINTFQWNGTPSSPLISNRSGIWFTLSDGTNFTFVQMVYNTTNDSYGNVNDINTNFTGLDDAIVSSSVTPVPLETEALPLVGATLFFAGGMWWKKKRAQAKASEFLEKK